MEKPHQESTGANMCSRDMREWDRFFGSTDSVEQQINPLSPDEALTVEESEDFVSQCG
jgi:hypothetical protein